MISVFIIESELQLIIASSLLKKNDIIIDVSIGIDNNYINSILNTKLVNYYKYSRVSRRHYMHVLFFLRAILVNKTYELYIYSDECLYFRCLNLLSKASRVNLIENGEKTLLGSKKKRPLIFHLGNIVDYIIAIIACKKISVSYASNNINSIVGFFPTNVYGIPQQKIDINLCTWPQGRSKNSANILCIGLLRFNKNKQQVIKKINSFLAIHVGEIYIKFHQRECQEVMNEIKGNYKLININHSMESYISSSKFLKITLNSKNSIYYYAKLFGVPVTLIDE